MDKVKGVREKRTGWANLSFLVPLLLPLWLAQGANAQVLTAREAYRQTLELFQQKDYEKAIPRLEQSMETYRLLKDHALYYLAESLFQNGQREQALKRFAELPRTFPESVWVERALARQGDVLVEMGKVSEGREAYRRFLAAYPQSGLVPEALLKVALGYIKEGDYEIARERLVSLWLDFPLTAQAAEAKRLIQQLEAAKKVEKKEPGAEAWLRRASILFEAGRFDLAVSELKALSRSPQLKAKPALGREVLLKLGLALFRSRQYDEARDLLTKIMRSFPQSEQGRSSLYWLGRLALRQDRKEEAEGRFEQIVQDYPGSDYAAQALLSLGQLAEEEKEITKAEARYRRVLAEYPDRADATVAKWRLSLLYLLTGEFEKAALGFKELADASVDAYRLERATFWQGKALEKMGAYEPAVKLYLELFKQAPLSYYGFRARERLKVISRDRDDLALAGQSSALSGNLPSAKDDNLHLSKARELAAIDLRGDATRELNRVLIEAFSEKGLILPVSQLFADMGDYSRSHLVIRRHFSEAIKQLPPPGGGIYWQLAYPRAYEPLVLKHAGQNGLPPLLIYAVMREESAFDPLALSRSGAIGLMQIIPNTGRRIAGEHGLRPFDPKGLYEPGVNVQFGTWYLSRLLEQYAFQDTLALAAYNVGPAAVNKWLAEKGYIDLDLFVEQIPYEETRGYVQRVLKSYFAYQTIYRASQP